MKSPFPGMDPYLERHWRDVHTRLMVYAGDQLNEQLPPDLQALVEESLDVTVDDRRVRTVYPDVSVVEEPTALPYQASPSRADGTEIADPYIVAIADDYFDEPQSHRHIEIIDVSDGRRLIAAIEFLSPANKTGKSGREAYCRKRREYFAAGANLVEIDLVRQGDFVLAVPQAEVPSHMQAPYLCCVRRSQQPDRAELYHAPLRHPLPNIPVPLRPTDPDAVLQLQPLIEECYRRGRHEKTDYSGDPNPPLNEDDAQWADALLREKGLR